MNGLLNVPEISHIDFKELIEKYSAPNPYDICDMIFDAEVKIAEMIKVSPFNYQWSTIASDSRTLSKAEAESILAFIKDRFSTQLKPYLITKSRDGDYNIGFSLVRQEIINEQ